MITPMRAKYCWWVVSIFFITFMSSCSREDHPSSGKDSPVRTDVAPIADRLPALADSIDRVFWKSTRLTIDSTLSPPSRDIYSLKGFVLLRKEAAAKMLSEYEWIRQPDGWQPSLIVEAVGVGSGGWFKSDAFAGKVKPKEIPGAVYFCREQGMLYIDIEVE